jgi:hypothetical protein
MNMKPAKSVFLLLMVIPSFLGQTGYASAQATAITLSLKLPIAFDVFVPCAAGGAGEFVSLSGTLHGLVHLTFDANGAFHAKFHDQPQRLSGFGQTSGAAYQGTGVTQDLLNTNPSTFVNNFRIIGQGPNNNFLVHEFFHITRNANEETTIIVDFVSVECR